MRVTNKMTYVGYGLLLEEDTNGTIFVSSPDIPELTTFGKDSGRRHKNRNRRNRVRDIVKG